MYWVQCKCQFYLQQAKAVASVGSWWEAAAEALCYSVNRAVCATQTVLALLNYPAASGKMDGTISLLKLKGYWKAGLAGIWS